MVNSSVGSGFCRVNDVAAGAACASLTGDRCCRPCCQSGRQGCGCSQYYITGVDFIRTDGISMMFMNVVVGTLVLSSTSDFYQVWAIAGFMEDSGREPQALCIIEDRDSLSSKEWGSLYAASAVICGTLEGTFIELVMVSSSMWVCILYMLWCYSA